jgi:hypothetical protein
MNKFAHTKRNLKPLFRSLTIFSFLLSSLFFIVSHQSAYAEYDYAAVTPVLNAAESFFSFLKKDNYSASWDMLSKETRQTIITDIHKTYKKMGGTIKKEDIQRDFENRGNIFLSYWKAFATNFNPDMILNDSRWEVGFIEEQKAEIIIRYKKSSNPAKLKLFKENGAWKVGLTETFWSRNNLY